MNPWHPMTDAVDLKHLGKLGEETGELSTVACRCIIQGIDEEIPGEGKTNRRWLEEEIADVLGNIDLNIKRFGLDMKFIALRAEEKKRRLRTWHAMA